MVKWADAWSREGRIKIEKVSEFDGLSLANFLKNELPRQYMSEGEIRQFESLANNIGTLYQGCIQRGGYTIEARRFFAEYEPLAGESLLAHVLH